MLSKQTTQKNRDMIGLKLLHKNGDLYSKKEAFYFYNSFRPVLDVILKECLPDKDFYLITNEDSHYNECLNHYCINLRTAELEFFLDTQFERIETIWSTFD